MKIAVRFRGIERSNALTEYVVQRVHFQLSRFNGAVSSVVVHVSDINGPRGGVDKRCQVTVRGPSLGSVTTEHLSGDAYSSVDMAIERAACAARRELERGRASRRGDTVLRRA